MNIQKCVMGGLAFALLFTLCMPVSSAASGSGIVTVARGDVTVSNKPAVALMSVYDKTKISVANGARAIIYMPDTGTEYELFGPGVFRTNAGKIETANSSTGKISKRVMHDSYRLMKLNTNSLLQAGTQLRGLTPPTIRPDSTTVLPGKIVFSWPLQQKIGVYVFRLRDAQQKVLFTRETDAATITVEDLSFAAAQQYRWDVSWYTDRGQPQTLEASFTAADADTVAQAATLIADAKGDSAKAALLQAWLRSRNIAVFE